MKPIVDLLKLPQTVTFIVAVVVSLLAPLAGANLPVPEGSVAAVVGVFWAVFVGATFEGAWKGVDYAGGIRQVLNSSKFRMALVSIGVVVLATAAKLFGYDLPEESASQVIEFLLLAVLSKAGLDGFRASASVRQ